MSFPSIYCGNICDEKRSKTNILFDIHCKLIEYRNLFLLTQKAPNSLPRLDFMNESLIEVKHLTFKRGDRIIYNQVILIKVSAVFCLQHYTK